MRRALAVLLGTTALVLGGGAVAVAGEWVQVSCVNPDQSAAASNDWVSMIGGGGYGSNTSTACGPGSPMFGLLSTLQQVGVGSNETLRYIPPGGSSLNGGVIDVALFADGRGYDASGTAVAYTPEYVYDRSNVFFQCASGLAACSSAGYDYSGELTIPPGRGGDLYLSAGCGGGAGASCNEGGSEGGWSLVQLWWANLRLANDSAPVASGFGGGLLAASTHGTADMTLTASDPGGPGVYRLTLEADGRVLYDATPDANGGSCVPVGTQAGALMFDAGQPCKQTEALDVPIDTTQLANGEHELRVTVSDAAENRSVIYDAPISVENAASGALAASAGVGGANGVGASEGARLALLGASTITRPYSRRRLRLAGRLLNAGGAPIAGAGLEVRSQALGSTAVMGLAHASTAANGTFIATVPPGTSRTLYVGYRAFSDDLTDSARAAVKENVRAGVSLRVTPRRTSPNGSIALSGTVTGPMPRRGVVVELLVRYLGQWEPFRTPRSDARGRFHLAYRFQGASGRFPFRAEVLAGQSGFPYSSGTSRMVDVRTG